MARLGMSEVRTTQTQMLLLFAFALGAVLFLSSPASPCGPLCSRDPDPDVADGLRPPMADGPRRHHACA